MSYRLISLISAAAALLTIAIPTVGVGQPSFIGRAPATIFGVGDISHCASPQDADLTGKLMHRLLAETPNSIGVTFGDNSNDDGSEEAYRCLDGSAWGRLMPRLYPTPGNHDYEADRVLPFYFLYFVNAGRPNEGYYAYDFGGWRIYALNTELMSSEPAAKTQRDAQLAWLGADLRQRHSSQCTMAYFHRPPFSSGRFASPAWSMPLFRKLYAFGVDLVATGHEHFFASLPPLTPDGSVDRTYGVPLLIAGTGGAVQFERPRTLKYEKHGEVLIAKRFGLLKLTLKPQSYDWDFLAADTAAVAASGSGRCHDNPPGVVG